MTLDVLELSLERLDARPDEPAVGLELGFARTPEANATADTGQVGPHAREAREQILQLRELDLELGFVRTSPSREDVENDFRPVHHAHTQLALEIAALRGGELFVEDHQRGAGGLHLTPDLFHFPLADERGRTGGADVLHDAADDLGTGRVDEASQFFKMFRDMTRVR